MQISTASPVLRPSRSAVARIQQRVSDEVLWQSTPSPDGLHLRNNAQSLFKPQTDGDAKGTVLLFHGFTAAPWQYNELADKLHGQGYNVYAPRMPGHGLADDSGQPSDLEIPASNEGGQWKEFVDETFAEAADLGAPVYAVGLSGGGNVALSTAHRHKEVAGVLTMAPFLGGNGLKGALFPVINFLDTITFGLLGKALDHVHRKDETNGPDDPTPRTSGTWGQALAMYRVGAEVKGVDQPLQVVGTAGDILSGAGPQGKLLDRSAPSGPDGWYHFPAGEGVQHAMISRQENSNTASVETVEAIITDFVGKGQLTDRRP